MLDKISGKVYIKLCISPLLLTVVAMTICCHGNPLMVYFAMATCLHGDDTRHVLQGLSSQSATKSKGKELEGFLH